MLHRQVFLSCFCKCNMFYDLYRIIKYYFLFYLLLAPPCGGFDIECTFSNGTLYVFIYRFIILSQFAEMVVQCRL